jgi:hypothetical protein
MYRWELDDAAKPEFAALSVKVRVTLAELMDAAVVVDPLEYQHHVGESADPPKPLRALHFGDRNEGLVTFLVCPPDELVLVVQIQWLPD